MYGYDNTALAQQSVTRVPELGRLKSAAERVAGAASAIDAFLYRFHGPRAETAGNDVSQPPDSYRNDIDCLFAQLTRLEDSINALTEVG